MVKVRNFKSFKLQLLTLPLHCIFWAQTVLSIQSFPSLLTWVADCIFTVLRERHCQMYLMHFIELQYRSLSQQDLLFLPSAYLVFLQKKQLHTLQLQPFFFFFSSFQTLLSENSLTIAKPGAMMQLAKMQMESFLSWSSFTCRGKIGKMRWERLLCAWALQSWNDTRVEFVIVQGESAVCHGQGDTSAAVTRFHFSPWSYTAAQSCELIWSNTASCRGQNGSISVCS